MQKAHFQFCMKSASTSGPSGEVVHVEEKMEKERKIFRGNPGEPRVWTDTESGNVESRKEKTREKEGKIWEKRGQGQDRF